MSTKYIGHGFCLSILFVAASALSTGCLADNGGFSPESEVDSDGEEIDDELDPRTNPLNGSDEIRDMNDHSKPTHGNGDDMECPSEDDPGVVFLEDAPPMCEGISILCPSGWEPIPPECGCGCERYGLLPAEDFSAESSSSSDPSVVVVVENLDEELDEMDDLFTDDGIIVDPPLPPRSLTR